MKGLLFPVLLFLCPAAFSQQLNFTPHTISLPPELSYYDNQFSSLYIHADKLFLMTECRLQDNAEAKVYSVDLGDIEHKLTDTSFSLPFRKYHIYNMDLLRQKMKEKGDDYEGAEAMVISGDDVFFSIETATPSANCYLLKGHLNATDIVMDPEEMVTLPKPVNRNRTHIYNAGFEAVELNGDNLYSFFEYNFFPEDNYVKMVNAGSFEKGQYHTIFTDRIPFRLTDITASGPDHFTGINYFYKGGGDDAVYRMPPNESSADRLTRDSTGAYHSYCRLIDIRFTGQMFTWKTLWEMPETYWGYNWEGLALYKEGYFIINDKYTPKKPYSSVLMYLKKSN